MIKKLIILSLFVSSSFTMAMDDLERTTLAKQPAKILWESSEKQLKIPLKDDPTELRIEFPSIQKTNKTIALRFRARFDWPTVGGANNFLGIRINGEALTPQINPILNRTEFESVYKNGNITHSGISGWWKKDKNHWRVILQYSPDFDEFEPRVLSDLEERHWYLIDVGSQILSGDTPNVLILENSAVSSIWPNGAKPTDGIVIEGLSLVELE